MTTKCDNCNKGITKTRPGLECHRCEKTVHLSNLCTGLTKKQITALRATENLEWTCSDCQNNATGRRSLIIPSDDEEEDEDRMQIDIKKLTSDISKEVEKAIKKEMKDVIESIQYNSDKMEELIQTIEIMKGNINSLQKKNIELTNRNNNLETRVGVLEQRVQEMEQRNLNRHIEIHHIPSTDDNNLIEIVSDVAKKLDQNVADIEEVKRLSERNGRPGVVQIKLKNEENRISWISAVKSNKIKISDIIPGSPKSSNSTIFICEALTQYNKQLLFNTKQELKDLFRYIWFKNGVLRVRKEGAQEKTYVIRSQDDVKKIKSYSATKTHPSQANFSLTH